MSIVATFTPASCRAVLAFCILHFAFLMSPSLEALITLQHLETQIAEAKAVMAGQPQRLADADARLNDRARRSRPRRSG